ncbi:hypothetical protein GF323_01615 [Candidatus Woesearchaeota archaeon]|nr:hypothetical protein [Candidatus Woesearchaeota archaeon]
MHEMPKIQFYLIDARRADFNNRQAVALFGRTASNRKICVIDDSIMPYFYVVPKKGESLGGKLKRIEVERNEKISRIVKTRQERKKYFGREVEAVKAYVSYIRDIRIIKSVIEEWDAIEGIFEHDVPYLRKYLAEKGFVIGNMVEAEAEPVNTGYKVDTFLARETKRTEESIKQPRILAFDIETYNPDNRIDMKNNPIVMVSFYSADMQKVITWKRFKPELDYIEFVNSEAALVGRFKDIIEKYSPDILTGYNTDAFDFPYLLERAKKYKINFNLGLDNSPISFLRKDFERIRLSGIANVDIFRFGKRNMSIDSLSLGEVTRDTIGKDKKGVDISKLHEIWDEGGERLEEYCEYNLRDSELAYDLLNNFLANIIELAKLTGLTLDKVTRVGYSQMVESFLLRQAFLAGEIAPNRPDKNEIAKRFLNSYKGSFVFQPEPGIYDNVIVFDFRSLYPSIIVEHNISPETLDCDCCRISGGHYFCRKKKGFIPSILEDLITRRIRIGEIKDGKNVFLEARQENLKLLANSFYGYLGFYAARWYSIECANTITSLGRHYIKQVIDKAANKGFDVIYSDTDSVFMTLKGKTRQDALEFLESANSELPGLMELEFQGIYRRGLFVSTKESGQGAKKKYALLSEDGQIKIRGFETVRKNWSEVARDAQRNVLEMILKERDAKKALDYTRDVIGGLRSKQADNSQTVIQTTLQKDVEKYDSKAPHVTVARRMKEKGFKIGPGAKIRYIVAEGEGKVGERAKLPSDVQPGEYDTEYYVHNQVVPAVERIFGLLGYGKEELVREKGQKRLEEF